MHSDLRNAVGDWGNRALRFKAHSSNLSRFKPFRAGAPWGRARSTCGATILSSEKGRGERIGWGFTSGLRPDSSSRPISARVLAPSNLSRFKPFREEASWVMRNFSTGPPSSERKMVGAKGFEPSTSWSQTRRSTRLSYAPLKRGVKRRRIRIAVKNILKSIAIERTSIGITSVDAYRMA